MNFKDTLPYSNGTGAKDSVQTQFEGIRQTDSDSQAERVKHEDSGLLDIEPALDQAITRRFDRHIVPWLFGLWLLAFIDRSNIGNARLDGLETDLGLVGNRFNIVSCSIQSCQLC